MAKVAIAELSEKSLETRVASFWKSREKSGVEGLQLLDICIQRAASQSRDWDGLARFFKGAQGSAQLPVVKKIMRAAFGDKLTYKADAKHKAGGVFTIGWEGSFNLLENPVYAEIAAGVAAREGWDSKIFATRMNKVLPKVEPKARVVSEESMKKVVSHLATYTKKLEADGFNIGEVIAALQKELAAKVVA